MNEAKGAASRYIGNKRKEQNTTDNAQASSHNAPKQNGEMVHAAENSEEVLNNPENSGKKLTEQLADVLENTIIDDSSVLPSPLQVPKQPPPTLTRQKSKQTEVVRKNHVEDALERWNDIVVFCKEVPLFNFTKGIFWLLLIARPCILIYCYYLPAAFLRCFSTYF